jgi:hypothetical protein
LHLLKHPYGRVTFADAVYREVVIDGMRYGYADASTLFQYLIDVDQVRFNFAEIERRMDIWISPSLPAKTTSCRRCAAGSMPASIAGRR